MKNKKYVDRHVSLLQLRRAYEKHFKKAMPDDNHKAVKELIEALGGEDQALKFCQEQSNDANVEDPKN